MAAGAFWKSPRRHAMTEPVKIVGLKELGRAFDQLSQAGARNTARKVLKIAGQPVYEDFSMRAPRSTEPERHMADSGGVSFKLSKRQKKLHRKTEAPMFAEMFIGPGPDPAAWTQEFGTVNHVAQPSLTPAWEAGKAGVLVVIKKLMWMEIKATAKRAARKTARLAAKG